MIPPPCLLLVPFAQNLRWITKDIVNKGTIIKGKQTRENKKTNKPLQGPCTVIALVQSLELCFLVPRAKWMRPFFTLCMSEKKTVCQHPVLKEISMA